MLHRLDEDSVIAITQPSHAWISGQLAHYWGNNEAGFERPTLELQIATEQHDIAWLSWEARPTLNPETGLPYTFSQLPTADHLDIWRTATSLGLAYGRTPALLISMHGTYLYERFHDFSKDDPAEAQMARRFLEHELERQGRIYEEVRRAGDISPGAIRTQRQFLSLWDAMSLAICMGFDGTREFDGVPENAGSSRITIHKVSGTDNVFTATPWPFTTDEVTLRCEGRKLTDTFDDQEVMRRSISVASSVPLEFLFVNDPD